MEIVKIVNATASFFAEIAMLILLAIGGYDIVSSSKLLSWVVSITLPLIAILFWGYFNAPKSNNQLRQPYLCVSQLLVFTIAAVIAYGSVSNAFLIVYVVIAYVSSILALYINK